MNTEVCKHCRYFQSQQLVECRFLLKNKEHGKFLIFPHFCNHPAKNSLVGHRVVELPLSIIEQMEKRPYKKLRPLMDLTYCIQDNRFREIPYKIDGMKEWFNSWFDGEYIFKECPYYVEHLMGSYHESRNLQKM